MGGLEGLVGGLGVAVEDLRLVAGGLEIVVGGLGIVGSPEVIVGSRRVVECVEVVVGSCGEEAQYLNRRNWLLFSLPLARKATWPPRT